MKICNNNLHNEGQINKVQYETRYEKPTTRRTQQLSKARAWSTREGVIYNNV